MPGDVVDVCADDLAPFVWLHEGLDPVDGELWVAAKEGVWHRAERSSGCGGIDGVDVVSGECGGAIGECPNPGGVGVVTIGLSGYGEDPVFGGLGRELGESAAEGFDEFAPYGGVLDLLDLLDAFGGGAFEELGGDAAPCAVCGGASEAVEVCDSGGWPGAGPRGKDVIGVCGALLVGVEEAHGAGKGGVVWVGGAVVFLVGAGAAGAGWCRGRLCWSFGCFAAR